MRGGAARGGFEEVQPLRAAARFEVILFSLSHPHPKFFFSLPRRPLSMLGYLMLCSFIKRLDTMTLADLLVLNAIEGCFKSVHKVAQADRC